MSAALGSFGNQRLGRIIPSVKREIESAPMNRQKASSAEQRERLQSVFGTEVDVAPSGMKGSDFEHDEIENAELGFDLGKLFGEARIAAEEERVARTAHAERRPKCRIA